MSAEAVPEASRDEWTIDELTQRTGVPVRTIREYQSMGLLPPPRRSGRIGLYGPSHLGRLELIGRLQARGYSLAAIGDLLASWRDGAALADILGLEPDQLVHVDEPGVAVTIGQLTEAVPTVVPEHFDDLVATGIVENCGPDRYCIPSPSLLQLTTDLLAAGLDPDTVLGLLRSVRTAADTVADAVIDAFGKIPEDADRTSVETLVGRGRGALGHGLGRLALHRVGRRASVPGQSSPADIAALLTRTARGRSNQGHETP